MTNRFFRALVIALLCIFSGGAASAADANDTKFSPEQIEFFEKHVRPVLIERCFECHSSDAEDVEAGLLIDSRQALLTGGESGPAIVPGNPKKSLLIQSIRYLSFEMPPKGKLRPNEIASLVKWVKMGAPWPRDGATPVNVATAGEKPLDWKTLRQEHWAFRPVASPAPPQVKNTTWPQGDIDRFVLTRLESSGLKPAPPADRRVLVRRVYFDLIGLPPTPEEVDAFVNNSQPDAYARLIDRLLDSPHYGERWGRHWLDVARYSDGFGGFLDNRGQPHAWRYRDWVIDAFNRDLPYDEFVRMQLAGDLIDKEHGAVATGFFALGPTYISDGGDPVAKAQAMSETLDDRVDTLTRGILALTVSCARCHEHKFDPIPQLDYYSLAGVFNNTNVIIKPIAPQPVIDRYNKAQQEIREHDASLRTRERNLKKDGRKPTAAELEELKRLRTELDQLKKNAPPALDSVHALVERGSADMKLALRGNLLRLGPVAPRRFLRILTGADPPKFTKGSGRIELAEAITSAENPLTARVFVNRIWMHHFGQALVRTPSNFGTLGEKPTHPLLLDWLASRFIEQGWSIKQLHREIMLSATYQMSSRYDERSFRADGDNRFIWRMNPRRLDVEAWRDALLTATGELDRKLGGPPLDNINVPRRTVYMRISRNGDRFQPDEFMRLFDFPAMRATVAQRTPSAVPQQYLFMMNNAYMLRRAELFAARLQKERQTNEQQIDRAYRLLFGRLPTAEEKQIGLAYLKTDNANDRSASQKRLRQYAQVLLSSNELMHIE
jgi:mono/diheme cytochrome c family protein